MSQPERITGAGWEHEACHNRIDTDAEEIALYGRTIGGPICDAVQAPTRAGWDEIECPKCGESQWWRDYRKHLQGCKAIPADVLEAVNQVKPRRYYSDDIEDQYRTAESR